MGAQLSCAQAAQRGHQVDPSDLLSCIRCQEAQTISGGGLDAQASPERETLFLARSWLSRSLALRGGRRGSLPFVSRQPFPFPIPVCASCRSQWKAVVRSSPHCTFAAC